MATVLTCAELNSTVATFAANKMPSVVRLSLQVLALSLNFNGGAVYAGNYGGIAPTFTPPSSAAIATDTVTLREWQWNGSVWT